MHALPLTTVLSPTYGTTPVADGGRGCSPERLLVLLTVARCCRSSSRRARCTGASLPDALASILGASAAPYLATWLLVRGGLGWVGGHLAVVGTVTLVPLLLVRETRGNDLAGTAAPASADAAEHP